MRFSIAQSGMKSYGGVIRFVCLLILAPLFIWRFALEGTVSLHNEIGKVEEQNRNIPAIAASARQVYSPASFQPLLSNGRILKEFEERFAENNVQIAAYMPEVVDAEDNHALYIAKITLAGNYIELVRTIAAIEKVGLPVKIISVNCEYDNQKKDAPDKVLLNLFIMQIEQR